MAGNSIGGKKSAATVTARDPNFYKKIGRIGGSKTGIKKGFALMSKEDHLKASLKGGTISRRGK